MIHEFKELIQVNTPLGKGLALFIECGNHDYWWNVILNTGAVVSFPQNKIKVSRSYSHGRGINDKQMRKIVR